MKEIQRLVSDFFFFVSRRVCQGLEISRLSNTRRLSLVYDWSDSSVVNRFRDGEKTQSCISGLMFRLLGQLIKPMGCKINWINVNTNGP